MDPRDHFPTLPTTTNGAQLPSLLRAPAISPINLTWDETTALTPVPTLVPALPGRVWLPRGVRTRGANVNRADGLRVPVNARTLGAPMASSFFR